MVAFREFILAARSDARISGYTVRRLPESGIRAVEPEILARRARKNRLQTGFKL
jgi:hypothetical protein